MWFPVVLVFWMDTETTGFRREGILKTGLLPLKTMLGRDYCVGERKIFRNLFLVDHEYFFFIAFHKVAFACDAFEQGRIISDAFQQVACAVDL